MQTKWENGRKLMGRSQISAEGETADCASHQVGGLVGAGSTAAVLARIVQTEGAAALFKGLSLNWVKGPVATSVSFLCFDFVNDAIKSGAAAAAAARSADGEAP